MIYKPTFYKRIGFLLSAVFFFFVLISNFSTLSSQNKKNISELYQAAENHYQEFIKDTSKHIYSDRWEQCVNKYREIIFLDDNSMYADDAAYMVGYIYLRMYERFLNQAYLNSSISSFAFLLSHYPESLYIPKTLFYSGYAYYKYKNEIEKAMEFLDLLVKKYPDNSYAEQARKLLDMMSRASVPIPPETRKKYATLGDVRYWSSPDFTRVVVYLDDPVNFINERLYNPDRIYLDLKNTRISPRIIDRMVVIEDNFLKRVRIGQFNPKTTRVVLDFEKVGRYTVFTLNDPERLVIDITGESYAKKKMLPELKKIQDETLIKGTRTTKMGTDQRQVASAETKRVRGDIQDARTADATKESKENLANRKEPDSDTKSTTVKSGEEPISAEAEKVALVPIRNSTGSYSLVRQLGLNATTIVIDPGHGGKDPGCTDSNGSYEKSLVLDIAHRLKKILEENNKFQVYLTRDSDEYLPLEERTAKAMQYKADIFISLHINSHRSNRIDGFETYYLGFAKDRQTEALAAKENAINQKNIAQLQEILKQMVGAKVDESRDLARAINSNFVRVMKKFYGNVSTRGVKQAPFIVLIGASMPSILIEIGYITNATDRQRLNTDIYRQRTAEALAEGIAQYVQSLKRYSEEG